MLLPPTLPPHVVAALAPYSLRPTPGDRAVPARSRGARKALLPLVLAAACGCRAQGPGRLHARLILQPHDTLQVTADAWVRRCAEGRGFLLEGVVGGNGVLLWLHGGDGAMRGEYPVLARGDTTTPRGFAGAVRFMLPTADRGVTLDSGVVTVSSAGARMDARARASGIDPGAGRRVVLDASFQAAPVAADTVNCRVELRP